MWLKLTDVNFTLSLTHSLTHSLSLSLSLPPSPSVKTAGGSGEHAGHPFRSHLKSMRRVKYVNCYSIVITNLI